jgi:anti-sigma B factor antagonist
MMDVFAADHRLDDAAVVVRAQGDIDSTTVPELVSALETGLALASRHPARLLVVDLCAVTYFGSAGLNALLACHSEGQAAGTSVHLVAAHDEVMRPLQVTKLDAVLPVYPNMEAAARPRRPETQS